VQPNRSTRLLTHHCLKGILIMPLTRSARVVVFASTVFAVISCGRAPISTRATPDSTRMILDRLAFGRDIPTGGTVSDSAWLVFLEQVVTPRFPNGFGVVRTEGQWRYADGRIQREAGFFLELYHAPGAPPDSTFEAIAREYLRRLTQEAVSRTRSPVQQWMYWSVKPH
jgi:hypothetical protein